MSLIKELFRNGLQNEEVTKESIELNYEIENIVNKIDLKKLDQKILEDHLYEASSCGEIEGFVLGFKVAVALMTECFN